MIWGRVIILSLFSGALWWSGLQKHRNLTPNEPIVQIPGWLSFFFSGRTNRILNGRGFLMQLVAIILMTVFSLGFVGQISRDETIKIFGWFGVVLALLALWILLGNRTKA